MAARVNLILATLAVGLAPGCFTVQAPVPIPDPIPPPRLPPTQPGFRDVGATGQSSLGERSGTAESRYAGSCGFAWAVRSAPPRHWC